MKTVVVICTHNGEGFIAEQLESIMSQSRHVDIVRVFDWGSVDRTLDVVSEFERISAVPKIRVTASADVPGAAESFFRALEMVSAEIDDSDVVFLCDQDDVWLPEKVEAMLGSYLRLDEDTQQCSVLMFHDVDVVGPSLEPIRYGYYTDSPFRLPGDLCIRRAIVANPIIGNTMMLSSALVREVTRLANRSEYIMHDWACLLFASIKGRIFYVDMRLSLYRQHHGNLIGAYRAARSGLCRRLYARALLVIRQARALVKDSSREGLPSSISRARSLHFSWWLMGQGWAWCGIVLTYWTLFKGPTLMRKGFSVFTLVGAIAGSRLRRN